jgi:hypothetical protein
MKLLTKLHRMLCKYRGHKFGLRDYRVPVRYHLEDIPTLTQLVDYKYICKRCGAV